MPALNPKPALTYEEAVSSLERRGIMPDRAPGLEMTLAGLKRFPFFKTIDPRKVVVVAGTNGKGSVCATLETLIASAGLRVGLYTSPHLIDTTERIRLAGQDISREEFLKAHNAVLKNTFDLQLSHFEMLTLMAAWFFFSAGPPVDWAIFEVGLGGIWDSTNAIPHHWCVVTALGLDHQNFLGSRLADIARNKFGIVGANATVIHAALPEDAIAESQRVREATGSRWIQAAPHRFLASASDQNADFSVETEWGSAPINLAGPRGAANTALALTTFAALGFDPQRHLGALSRVCWPGRMERFKTPFAPCAIYLSGDHNPQGIQSLIELLPYYERRHLHLLVGLGKDKDLDGVMEPLCQIPESSLYLTETPFKGRSLSDYGPWLERAQGAWSDPAAALSQVASRCDSRDLFVATGSLYLVGALRKALLDKMR